MDNHKHHGPGFGNGFLLGLIIGAAVVFLLGTKKGKQILKMLTENGIEGFSELQDLMEQEEDGDYEGDYEDAQEGEVMQSEKKHAPSSPTRPFKRFFRGVKK